MTDYLVLFSARPTISLSVKNLLSHLKIKEDLNSSYEEQQFVITRDSFNACFFLFRVELFSKCTKVASKTCFTMLSDFNLIKHLNTYKSGRTLNVAMTILLLKSAC